MEAMLAVHEVIAIATAHAIASKWEEYARIMDKHQPEPYELAPLNHRTGNGRSDLFPKAWPEIPRSSWNTSE